LDAPGAENARGIAIEQEGQQPFAADIAGSPSRAR
jgi:hypothetical protein